MGELGSGGEGTQGTTDASEASDQSSDAPEASEQTNPFNPIDDDPQPTAQGNGDKQGGPASQNQVEQRGPSDASRTTAEDGHTSATETSQPNDRQSQTQSEQGDDLDPFQADEDPFSEPARLNGHDTQSERQGISSEQQDEVDPFHPLDDGQQSEGTIKDDRTEVEVNAILEKAETKFETEPNNDGQGKLLPNEGKVGTFKELVKIGRDGDNLTPHHVPADKFMKEQGISRNDGIAIMMEQPTPGSGGRHRETRSYGSGPNLSETPREALTGDIADLVKIYREDGLYTPEMRESFKDVIRLNLQRFPDVFT